MEVTELTSTSDTVRLELTGGVAADEYGLSVPVRITRTDTDGPELSGGEPTRVFAPAGQAADLAPARPQGGHAPPDARERPGTPATAPAAPACGDWTVGPVAETFLDPRPAGTYDVYAVMPYGTDTEQQMVVSEPVTLEVPEVAVPEQEPPAVDIRDGYQPEWLAGTALE